MAGETSESEPVITLEFHGALADRFSTVGARHGSRTRVTAPMAATVRDLLSSLVALDSLYIHVFDPGSGRLPEHVELVLNDRVIDLQGGLSAPLHPGDVVAFLPAHAGGCSA